MATREISMEKRMHTVREGFIHLCSFAVSREGNFEISINVEFPLEGLAPGSIEKILTTALRELSAAQEARKRRAIAAGN